MCPLPATSRFVASLRANHLAPSAAAAPVRSPVMALAFSRASGAPVPLSQISVVPKISGRLCAGFCENQAVSAARFALHRGGGVVRFADLGVYRLLLPYLQSPALHTFARQTLEPLRVYDAEAGSHLLETLRAFCDCGQSFTRTAEALGQHENTVRRRLERIAAITGLSYREADQMEQLSLARKVELCQEIMG